MDDPNTNGDEPRLVLTGSGARVVLAETDAPGSLHYLLEAEGFQVVGCASDDVELGRVLGQGLRPDVIVLDADIVATSTLVARQLAPDAHVIAVWPEAVQPPPGGERVDPRLVYEELGPAIRRYMDRASVPVPVIAMPTEEPVLVGAAVAAAATPTAVPAAASAGASSVFGRAASRMSVLSVTLITAIVFTMGVSFALGGFRWHPTDGPARVVAPRAPGGGIDASDPLSGRVPPSLAGTESGGKPSDHPGGGGDHHPTGGFAGVVVTTTGSGNGDTGGAPPTAGGSGDPGGSAGDPGGQGGQGGQGGGQGDHGGGPGDHGGQGGGDHGGQGGGDHGGGGQGGGDGQHGGGGHGDGDGDDQGEDEQGDQGGDSQGGDGQGGDSQGGHSHGSHGPHGASHGAHHDAGGPTGDTQD